MSWSTPLRISFARLRISSMEFEMSVTAVSNHPRTFRVLPLHLVRRISGAFLGPPTPNDVRHIGGCAAHLPFVEKLDVCARGFRFWRINLDSERHGDGVSDEQCFTLPQRREQVLES